MSSTPHMLCVVDYDVLAHGCCIRPAFSVWALWFIVVCLDIGTACVKYVLHALCLLIVVSMDRDTARVQNSKPDI